MDKETAIQGTSAQRVGDDLDDDREIGDEALRLKKVEKVYRYWDLCGLKGQRDRWLTSLPVDRQKVGFAHYPR